MRTILMTAAVIAAAFCVALTLYADRPRDGAPRIRDIIEVSLGETIDTRHVTVHLRTVGGGAYTLWLDRGYSQREAGGWMGTTRPDPMPMHTVVDNARVRSITSY